MNKFLYGPKNIKDYEIIIKCNSLNYTMSITDKTTVKDVFNKVIKRESILDPGLFGLYILIDVNSKIWLKMDNKIAVSYKSYDNWTKLYFGCLILPMELIYGINVDRIISSSSLDSIYNQVINEIFTFNLIDTSQRLFKIIALKNQIDMGDYNESSESIKSFDIDYVFKWLVDNKNSHSFPIDNQNTLDIETKSLLESNIIKYWISYSTMTRYDATIEFFICIIGSKKFGLLIHQFKLENKRSQLLQLIINPRGFIIISPNLQECLNSNNNRENRISVCNDNQKDCYNTKSTNSKSKRLLVTDCNNILISWNNIQELAVIEKSLKIKFYLDNCPMKLFLHSEDFIINDQVNIFTNIYIRQSLTINKYTNSKKTDTREVKYDTIKPARYSSVNSMKNCYNTYKRRSSSEPYLMKSSGLNISTAFLNKQNLTAINEQSEQPKDITFTKIGENSLIEKKELLENYINSLSINLPDLPDYVTTSDNFAGNDQMINGRMNENQMTNDQYNQRPLYKHRYKN